MTQLWQRDELLSLSLADVWHHLLARVVVRGWSRPRETREGKNSIQRLYLVRSCVEDVINIYSYVYLYKVPPTKKRAKLGHNDQCIGDAQPQLSVSFLVDSLFN